MRLPWFLRPRKAEPPAEPWALHTTLLSVGNGESFTIDDSYRGCAVFGATGSAKSTTVCRELALAMVRAGYGGLVLSVKNERDYWVDICKQTGRRDDLLIVDERCEYPFNPLSYELSRTGRGAGSVSNVVALLSTLVAYSNRGSGDRKGSRENEGYWKNASEELLRAAISAIYLARANLTLDLVSDVINSAPRSPEEVASSQWRTTSRCCGLLFEAEQHAETPARQRELKLVLEYFLKTFPALPENTRGSIVSTYTSMADVLRHGLAHEMFGKETRLDPRVTEEGKIILVDIPSLVFGMQGLLANAIFAHCWKRAIERRDVRRSPRPNFFFVDESQHHVSADDALFLTTCRSARVACVFATQSVANYRVALGGGELGRETTDALLANLCHKWFMCNGCPSTNAYASSLCGEHRDVMFNASESRSLQDWPIDLFGASEGQQTAGYSESIQAEVRPEEFQRLRTGGPTNEFLADCILARSGNPFRDTGRVWRRITFKQSWLPRGAQ